MIHIIMLAILSLLAILIYHLYVLVDGYFDELHYLSSRKLRDLRGGIIACILGGLKKKDFKTRVYLACIEIELQKRGEKL